MIGLFWILVQVIPSLFTDSLVVQKHWTKLTRRVTIKATWSEKQGKAVKEYIALPEPARRAGAATHDMFPVRQGPLAFDTSACAIKFDVSTVSGSSAQAHAVGLPYLLGFDIGEKEGWAHWDELGTVPQNSAFPYEGLKQGDEVVLQLSRDRGGEASVIPGVPLAVETFWITGVVIATYENPPRARNAPTSGAWGQHLSFRLRPSS